MSTSHPLYKKHFASRPTSFAHAGHLAVEDEEVRTRLANLGWRVRAQVGRGYTRTESASTDASMDDERKKRDRDEAPMSATSSFATTVSSTSMDLDNPSCDIKPLPSFSRKASLQRQTSSAPNLGTYLAAPQPTESWTRIKFEDWTNRTDF